MWFTIINDMTIKTTILYFVIADENIILVALAGISAVMRLITFSGHKFWNAIMIQIGKFDSMILLPYKQRLSTS